MKTLGGIMNSEERVIKTEKIYEGRVVSLHCDTVELPGQKYAKREIVDHAGGVAILAFTDEGKVILVKQYRIATGKELLELPAGLIDHNENPKEAAIRVLEEETGWLAGQMDFVLEFYSSPGFTNEKVHLFIANDLSKTETNYDEFENIEILEYDLDEAIRMITLGQILDGKTVIGLLHAKIEKGEHK